MMATSRSDSMAMTVHDLLDNLRMSGVRIQEIAHEIDGNAVSFEVLHPMEDGEVVPVAVNVEQRSPELDASLGIQVRQVAGNDQHTSSREGFALNRESLRAMFDEAFYEWVLVEQGKIPARMLTEGFASELVSAHLPSYVVSRA